MNLKDRIKECSNIWVIYLIVGCIASALVGMAVYLLLLFWSIFYSMSSELTNILSIWYIKWLLIAVVESIFVLVVIKGLYKDTGDTVLIDVIKHGAKNKESKLINTYYVRVSLDDIEVSLKESKNKVSSIFNLKNLNCNNYGYIHFKSIDDVCFCSDLSINASKESPFYILKVEQYNYSGRRLLGSHNYNMFTLYDTEQIDLSQVNTDSIVNKNCYIERLYKAKVYDYPLSFKEDMEKGIKDSRISLCIIVACFVIIFGIYGWYRNYSSSAFMSDFSEVDSINDMVIYSDNSMEYVKYHTYITDSLALIPEKLKNDFIDSGWSLIFVDKDLATYEMLSSMVSPGTTSGCTFPFYKLIVIELPPKESDLNQAYLMQTVIHEFGHFLALRMMAVNDTWNDIYNKERDNYATDYAKSNMSEAFACGYSSYILYKDMFSQKTPLSYNYIKDIERKYLVGE